jgi:hypothetical protein
MELVSRKVNLLKPFDVGSINIRKDEYFADAFIVDLPLDYVPDHMWQDIFDAKWKSSRHLWDRKLYVLGNKLRLVTSPDDFGAKLNWVETMILETNKAVDEQLLAFQQEEERRTKTGVRKQTPWEERAKIEMIKDALRKKSA